MVKQGRCTYCGEIKQVAALKSWDDPTKERYYCQDHYFDVYAFQEK